MTGQTDDVAEPRPQHDAAPRYPWREGLGFAAVVALALAFHAHPLMSRQYLSDEFLYVNAAAKVQAGASSFSAPNYLGTAFFAHLVAWLANPFGLFPVAVAFRLLNVLAVATVAWLAAAESRTSLRVRIAIAAALVLLAPPFEEGLRSGNLSLMIAALTRLSLRRWASGPVFAGVVLGAGLVIKPYALGFLPVLLAGRLRPRSHANVVIAGVAVAIFALGLFSFPSELVHMLHSHEAMGVELRSLSLQRIILCFTGWGPRTSVVLVVVLVAAVIHTARVPRTLREVAHIALLASLLSLTRIWLHVLAITLPWAVAVLSDRARGIWATWHASSVARQTATLRLLSSTAVVVVLYGCDGFFALNILLPEIPPWLDGVATLLPFVALVLLFGQSRQVRGCCEP